MKIRIIGIEDVKKILSMKDTIRLVELAFKEKGLNRVQMPAKSYLFFDKYKGDLRTMPSYLVGLDQCGIKIVNVHPQNPEKHNLPTIMATILVYDPATGAPKAIMDGTWITAMRTGAATGVATRYLARSNVKTVGLVGAGFQAPFQLEALKEVMKLESVKVYRRSIDKAKDFAKEMSSKLNTEVSAVERPEDAVKDVDVLVTLTTARGPVVKNEWIKEGTHINAIGADAPGKQELDPAILSRARIVVDDWEQASHSGEINVPLEEGLIKKDMIYGELGEVVAGLKPGRISDDEITVFDSTGLSIQDVTTSWHVYSIAAEKNLGIEIDAFYLPKY